MGTPDSTTRRAKFEALAQEMRGVFEEGEPAVLRGHAGLFEVQEVFDWIRVAHPPVKEKQSAKKIDALKTVWGLQPPSEADRSGGDPGRLAEMFTGISQLLDACPFLPTAEHRDFQSWVDQTKSALDGPFGMQAPGLECASWDAFDRLQTLLGPTLELTGPRSYRINAFLGDYRRTPFGFHIDPHHEGVFQYVVHGARKAFFWEGLLLQEHDAAWVGCPSTKPFKSPEVSFELVPGDIVFWPGTHVHGFEASGPSMALSLVIDKTSPRLRPEVVSELEVRTACGAAALPAIAPVVEFGLDDRLCRRSRTPIAYERHDDDLIIGVCGRTVDWPDRASATSVVALLEDLNQRLSVGESMPAGVLCEAHASPCFSTEDMLETFAMLASFGFLGHG